MSNKPPYYVGKPKLGLWGIYKRCKGYTELIVYCDSEEKARNISDAWNGQYYIEQNNLKQNNHE